MIQSRKEKWESFGASSFAFGRSFRTAKAAVIGMPIRKKRFHATLSRNCAVKLPVTSGISPVSDSDTPTLVVRNEVTTNSTLPPRKRTITGAALAVGVMPVKNAACARSFDPVSEASSQAVSPITIFAPRIRQCPARGRSPCTFTCRKMMNSITCRM